MRGSVHASSRRQDWNTPQSIIDMIAPLGPIALDPCSNATSIVPAAIKLDYSQGQCGLQTSWVLELEHSENKLVYVNPPYGREVGTWIRKCRAEYLLGCDVVALVAARTDTRWFQEAVQTVSTVAFLRGRQRFLGAEQPAPFPSALLLWSDSELKRALFSVIGQLHGFSLRARELSAVE